MLSLYVGALYALTVWLLRRAGLDLPRRVAALFFGLVLVFVGRPMVQDRVLVAADVVKLTPPWSEMRPAGTPRITKYEVSNLNLQDATMQIVPWAFQVRESWRALEVPLWNAANGTGYPLLANGQSTPLAPLRLLTLPLSFAAAWTAECALKLLAALLLTFLFCRRRYSVAASILAAIAYGFSTWMTIWLQFPIAGASAFLPGVLLCIDLLLERFTRERFIAASLLFAAAVLSGHPETVFQVGLFAGSYGLWVALIERGSWRPLLSVAGAAVVAALLSSPFLVPFFESVVRSQRLADVRETPEMTVSPLPRYDSAVLLLQPRFFGELPVDRPWSDWTVNESICGFSGVLAIVASIAAAIFIVTSRRWRERETLYVLAVFSSLAIILGAPVITQAFHLVAGLAPDGRMRFGICWFASLLVAAVVDWSRRESRRPLLIATLVVSSGLLTLMLAVDFPTPTQRRASFVAMLPSVAVLVGLLLFPLRRVLALALLTLLAVLDVWMVAWRWNPSLPMRELYPVTPLIARLQQLRQTDPQPFRIVGTGGQLYPNTGIFFGFDDSRVHDPMASHRYLGFLEAAIGWEPRRYYEKWNDADTAILDLLNVKYVVTEPDRALAAPRYEQLYAGRDGRIYANRHVLPLFFPVRHVLPDGDPRTHTDWQHTALVSRLPRRFREQLNAPWTTADARVDVTQHSGSHYTLQIAAPRATVIASSIALWPGWRAGAFPVVETNHAFLGFVVPAGNHTVEVTYRPLSFYVPAAVALLTLVGLAFTLLRRRGTNTTAASVTNARAAPPQNDIGT
jgi:hypothetical protein